MIPVTMITNPIVVVVTLKGYQETTSCCLGEQVSSRYQDYDFQRQIEDFGCNRRHDGNDRSLRDYGDIFGSDDPNKSFSDFGFNPPTRGTKYETHRLGRISGSANIDFQQSRHRGYEPIGNRNRLALREFRDTNRFKKPYANGKYFQT